LLHYALHVHQILKHKKFNLMRNKFDATNFYNTGCSLKHLLMQTIKNCHEIRALHRARQKYSACELCRRNSLLEQFRDNKIVHAVGKVHWKILQEATSYFECSSTTPPFFSKTVGAGSNRLEWNEDGSSKNNSSRRQQDSVIEAHSFICTMKIVVFETCNTCLNTPLQHLQINSALL